MVLMGDIASNYICHFSEKKWRKKASVKKGLPKMLAFLGSPASEKATAKAPAATRRRGA